MNYVFSILLLLIFATSTLKAQITIGSLEPPHESAVLELKSENNDKGVIFPKVALRAIWDTITIPKPEVGLFVMNTNDSDPSEVINISERVRANRFYSWSGEEWVELIGYPRLHENIEIAFSALGVPRSALFVLNGDFRIMPTNYPNMRGVLDLLKGISANDAAYLPLVEQINLTNGNVTMTNVNGQTTIKFKPGVYEIKFVYEFVPASTAGGGIQPPPQSCTLSSYFMDFPLNRIEADGTIRTLYGRVYSNCTHTHSGLSNHGNAINYITIIYTETLWPVRLGRGIAGNCEGVSGFAMPNRSNFLSISRVGDIQINKSKL